MTNPMPQSQNPTHDVRIARRGRNGEAPRWKILYDAMVNLSPDEIITYQQMADLLGLGPETPRTRSLVHAAARRATQELETQAGLVFILIRGEGYQRAQPASVITLAGKHQERALAEIESGASKIATIDLMSVDSTTAALARATGMAFARQAAAMRSMDVRQRRLATALNALGTQVDDNAHRLAQLESRVNALGGNGQSVASTPPYPPQHQQPAPQPVYQQQQQLPPAAPYPLQHHAPQPPAEAPEPSHVALESPHSGRQHVPPAVTSFGYPAGPPNYPQHSPTHDGHETR